MLIAAFLFLFFQFPSVNGGRPEPPNLELDAANQLFLTGKFPQAEKAYGLLLTRTPGLEAAEVGLVRSLLRQQKLDESLDVVNKALLAHPTSAPLLAVKGDLQYRRAEISAAETSYKAAISLSPQEARAHLGLSQVYGSSFLYRQAYEHLQIAHEVAPDDIEIRRAWLRMLPRKDRLTALEAYLSGPHPDDEEQTTQMLDELEFLRSTIGKPIHECKLVNRVESAETNLEMLHALGVPLRGVGLPVSLNDQRVKLLLDTGAPGIMVDRRVAESAHLTHISGAHHGGFGDEGLQAGYAAVADDIRVGGLEFRDCIVSVSNDDKVLDQDGTIGTNVFASYLIDLDFPAMRFRLSSLPKRPEDSVVPRPRKSSAEDPLILEAWSEEFSRELYRHSKFSLTRPPSPGPQDRYISPEMADWTKVFHTNHLLLVPTNVEESNDDLLFGIDTGVPSTILSTHIAGQIDKSPSKTPQYVRGMSGQVKIAYSTQATVSFAGLERQSKKLTAVDLSSTNRRLGIEISGMLGFGTLRLLDVKLDYRDGLVDFVYAPDERNSSSDAQPDAPKPDQPKSNPASAPASPLHR